MEIFYYTKYSLPFHDPSIESIYFECHEGILLYMNMCQDQDFSVINDDEYKIIIDPFPYSTNVTLYKVYYNILSLLFLPFTYTQLLSLLVDVSPTWGYCASLLITTCNLYYPGKETIYVYSL